MILIELPRVNSSAEHRRYFLEYLPEVFRLSKKMQASLLRCFLAFFLLTNSVFVVHAQLYSPVREQTALDIVIDAASDVNVDEFERAAPIRVRLYELRLATSFEAADFLSLQTSDRNILSTDMLVRDEFILRPGEKRYIRRKSHPDLGAIAVMAEFKDIAHSEWRAVEHIVAAPEVAWYRALIPATRLRLAVRLQQKGLEIVHLD